MTAAEAASLIKNGDQLAMSGFTPAGVAKATTKELAKIAQAEHEAGREFKVAIFTGASTGQSTDGDMANAQAIKYRAPYTTNPDFRKHVNLGEIPYNDLHLSHMAQELRYGFYGDIDWAILEVCDIEEVGDEVRVFLTAAGGISPTAARLAKKVILELNAFHSPNAKYIHDVYEPLDPPYRKPIPIFNVGDRIGKPYVSIPREKIAGVVECDIPDEARAFKDSDPVTDKIGYLTAEFLVSELHAGRIPKEFLPLQSGVGSTANAILGALGADKHVPDFNIYTEVIQNSVIDIPFDLGPEELDRISKAITYRFGGCRMSKVSSMLVRELGGELSSRADFVESLLSSIRENQPRDRRMVELSGATNMLEFPEYSDVSKAKTFLATVEQRDSMYRMLKKASNMEFTVTIGSENEQEGLQDCSVVTASYSVDGTPFGSFGVIGPTRMDYARVLSILSNVQNNLRTILQSYLKEE